MTNLNINLIYLFKRFFSKKNLKLIEHQNCLLISRNTFEIFSVYDEDFAGNYGHEDTYFESLRKFVDGKITLI